MTESETKAASKRWKAKDRRVATADTRPEITAVTEPGGIEVKVSFPGLPSVGRTAQVSWEVTSPTGQNQSHSAYFNLAAHGQRTSLKFLVSSQDSTFVTQVEALLASKPEPGLGAGKSRSKVVPDSEIENQLKLADGSTVRVVSVGWSDSYYGTVLYKPGYDGQPASHTINGAELNPAALNIGAGL